jgi:hypothetical protein
MVQNAIKPLEHIPVVGKAAQAFAWFDNKMGEFGGGVLKGAGSLVGGVANIVTHPVETASGLYAMAEHVLFVAGLVPNPLKLAHAGADIIFNGANPKARMETVMDPGKSLQDDAKFGKALVDGFVEPYKKSWSEGKYFEVAGRATFDIGSMFIGAGEANAAIKTGEVASVAAKTAEVASVASKTGEVASVASKTAEVANVASKTGEVANVTSKSGKAAEVASTTAKATEVAETAGKTGKASEVAANTSKATKSAEAAKAEAGAAKSSEVAIDAAKATKTSEQPAAKILSRNATGEIEPYLTRDIGKTIAENPVANSAYKHLQRQGTDVFLDYSARPPKGLAGQASGLRNEVEIFYWNNGTARDAVSTMVHESSHIDRFYKGARLNTQFDEYLAFRREFLFQQGRRPSLVERQRIWETVKDLYPDLPQERVPFGKATMESKEALVKEAKTDGHAEHPLTEGQGKQIQRQETTAEKRKPDSENRFLDDESIVEKSLRGNEEAHAEDLLNKSAPIESSKKKTGYLGSNEGHKYAKQIFPGGKTEVLGGHGGYKPEISPKTTVIPDGTTLTRWVQHDRNLESTIGLLIEKGRYDDIAKFFNEYHLYKKGDFKYQEMLTGAQSFLPGAEIPNYVHKPPTPEISIHEKATSAAKVTPLSEILEPNMGHIDWAACTKVY